MKAIAYLISGIFLFCGCESDSSETECKNRLQTKSAPFEALIEQLPPDVISGLAKDPTAEGALGRNQEGYFHVRFQLDIGFLASYATYFKSDEALSKFILATEYSFAHQRPAGDFELVIPADLLPLGQPTNVDLSSGISFFMAALGQSLVLLEQSSWFIDRPSDQLTTGLSNLKTKFQLSLAFLKTQKELLKQYDADAPNRLFFDALAFYAMGTYLGDDSAKAIGLEFIELALAKQDKAGFYIEGGGFDSSYNGVSIRVALSLLGIIPTQEAIYKKLQQSVSCSVQWQASRILTSGEISLQGNTRVFPGGEEFLGQEKSVAWIDTLLSFYFAYTLSTDHSFLALAEKVQAFYN